MAYARRRIRRRSTYRRRTSTRRRLPYRRRTRTRRPSRATCSKTVKLTLDGTWVTCNGTTHNPFIFSPTSIPGFLDYMAVYSHFRIKKCMLTISRVRMNTDNTPSAAGLTDNYLIVGSRPFAASVAPDVLSIANPNSGVMTPATPTPVPDYESMQLVPAQTEDNLRQTRWQRVLTPNNTRPYIHVGFYPYTMVGTFGPNSNLNRPTSGTAPVEQAVVYQRIWEARRWMPFAWAGGDAQTALKRPITFYGPYVVTDTALPSANGEITTQISINVTLTVYCQFKGQK